MATTGRITRSTLTLASFSKYNYPQRPDQFIVAAIPPDPLTLAVVNAIYAAKTGYVSTTEYTCNSNVSVFLMEFSSQANAETAMSDEGGPISNRTISSTDVTYIQVQMVFA